MTQKICGGLSQLRDAPKFPGENVLRTKGPLGFQSPGNMPFLAANTPTFFEGKSTSFLRSIGETGVCWNFLGMCPLQLRAQHALKA